MASRDDDRCPACGHHMNWMDGYGYICNKRGGCGSEWEVPEAPKGEFTCGLRVSCSRCSFIACANPEHEEYFEDPLEMMNQHKESEHRRATDE